MIDSIKIENYKNLNELNIETLSRVNLIIGKNNSGKSTLLEAIALGVTNCNINILNQILIDRGEFSISENEKNTIFDSLSSLFPQRNKKISPNNVIKITSSFQNKTKINILRFINYFDEKIKLEDGTIIQKRSTIDNDKKDVTIDLKYGMEIRYWDGRMIIPSTIHDFSKIYIFNRENLNYDISFIKSNILYKENNAKLWDKIALTDKEQIVIDGLKILEPTVERIAFVEGRNSERSAIIKMKNVSDTVPLQSMGDGINKIFTIILALVNSENGYLLIDEFENGLHYSVQEKLWEIIFELAEKLNVQVFATTHSQDCISGFEKVLNDEQNKYDGKLIRLDVVKGKITTVEFLKGELKVANDSNIEIR